MYHCHLFSDEKLEFTDYGRASVTTPKPNPGILNSSPMPSACETFLLKIMYQDLTSGVKVYIKSRGLVCCFGFFFQKQKVIQ